MRWTDFCCSPLLVAGLVGAAGTVTATGAAADTLVVRATGPSAPLYAVGKTLPDGTHITLKASDQLVLLDAHGTRTLAGPGSFVAGAQGQAASTSMLALASAGTERRARIGAVRDVNAASVPTRRPNIWFVDTGLNGPVCILDPKAVTLWRADPSTDAQSTIQGDAGASATVTWIKGQTTQDWPAAVPITDGKTYHVANGTAAPVSLQVRMVPQQPDDLQSLAAALIAHNCKDQLDVLIATSSGH